MKHLIWLSLLTLILASCGDDDAVTIDEELIVIDGAPECISVAVNDNSGNDFTSFNRVLEINAGGELYYDLDNTECCDRGGFTFNAQCDTVCTIVGFTGARTGDNCPDLSGEDVTFRILWER